MSRRFRAATLSDRHGFFSPNGTNAWLDGRSPDGSWVSRAAEDAARQLRFLPLLRKTVTANMAAMVTAQVKVTVEPKVTDPRAEGVKKIAEGVIRDGDNEEDFWSAQLESRAAEGSQLHYGVFFRLRHNPNKQGYKTKETIFGEEMQPVFGEYACQHCGTGGPLEAVRTDEASGMSVADCPECGKQAEVIEEPSEGPMTVPQGEKEKNAGCEELTVHTSYEIRVDERRTQGGNLREARWFEHHYAQSRDELEVENPNCDFGVPEEWSFSLKWFYSFTSGTDAFIHKHDFSDSDIFEVREICLLPEDYRTYRAPVGDHYILKDDNDQPILGEDGQPAFEIFAGEKLIDKFPNGFRFRITSKKILCGTPEDAGIKAYDFRTEWTYMGFTPDALSFWNGPLIEALTIGDDINKMYTIDIQHRERNSRSHIVTDGLMFDDEAWESDLTPTKAGVHLEGGDDIRKHYSTVESPPMRQALEGLQFLFEIAPQVGIAPPVAMGAPDNTDETYGGQRLKNQRQLMILAPYGQSKAAAKVNVFKQRVKLAQMWPDDRLNYLRSRFGEEWRDEDIEAFREMDIDKTLKFDYAEGSEVPTTLVEREQKLAGFLAQLIQAMPVLAQIAESPVPLAKMLVNDIRGMINQAAELGGIEYDIGNEENTRRLNERRYRLIKQGVEESQGPEDLQVLMSNPILQPLPKENHDAHIERWADRQTALMSEEEPNLPIVACCQMMIMRHEQAKVGDNQQEVVSQIQSEAPARQLMAGEQAAQGQEANAQAQGEQANAEAERAQASQEAERERAHTSVEADKQRAHEQALKGADVAMKQAEMASRERQAQNRQPAAG